MRLNVFLRIGFCINHKIGYHLLECVIFVSILSRNCLKKIWRTKNQNELEILRWYLLIRARYPIVNNFKARATCFYLCCYVFPHIKSSNHFYTHEIDEMRCYLIHPIISSEDRIGIHFICKHKNIWMLLFISCGCRLFWFDALSSIFFPLSNSEAYLLISMKLKCK